MTTALEVRVTWPTGRRSWMAVLTHSEAFAVKRARAFAPEAAAIETTGTRFTAPHGAQPVVFLWDEPAKR